jgi:transcriptional regulator with XRE-family HTH domain
MSTPLDFHTKNTLYKITRKIEDIRYTRDLSGRKLGAKAKVHYETIFKAEQELNYYSLPTLLKLCKALDLKVWELLKDLDI